MAENVNVIKVSVVEDNDRLRESLALLIDGSPGLKCSGTHRSAETALGRLPAEKPDVVLMDIELPGRTGIECVWELKQRMPSVPIMMLTAYDDPEKIFNSLRAGACGYLLKRTPPGELLAAIQELHRGGSPMSTQIARRVVASLHQPKPPKNSAQESPLTGRETEILAHLAKGYSNKEIANLLNVSLETVRTHLRHVYEKLHVHSRTEALARYFEK
ncbi:MAG TPA: response regulator transcription factor [Candidatus Kapabacteria bacterium]|nr:response regulator transcription factor [Candidatus Kapabacteria bacterium]